MADLDLDAAALRALLDKQEIRESLMRYARACDRVDAEGIRLSYHDDSWDDHGTFHGTGAEFASAPARFSPKVKMVHHFLGQTLIDLQGDVAFCETYFIAHSHTSHGMSTHMADVGTEPDSGPGNGLRPTPEGDDLIALLIGRYVDRFERRDGAWKVAVRKVVMDFAKEEPGPSDYSLLNVFVRGQRWPDDFVYRFDELAIPHRAK